MRDVHAPLWIIDVVDASGVRVPIAPGSGDGGTVADGIESVEWEDNDEGLSTFEMTVQNPDLSLLDGPLLFAGNAVRFRLGYDGDLTPERTYKIRSVRGFRTLTVEAVDPASALAETERSEVYDNASPSDVARKVAARHGLANVVADESDKRATITQSNESDAALLRRLARELGWTFAVDGDVLRFHARRTADAPVAEYDHRENEVILGLDVDADWLHLPGEVAARGFDADRRQVFEVKADADSVERTSLGGATMATYERQPGDVVRPDPAAGESGPVVGTSAPTKARAQESADAAFEKAERSQLKMTLTVVGDPRVRAGDVVRVVGLCKRLDGNYAVKRAAHKIDRAGYQTTLETWRNAVGKTIETQEDAATVNDAPASGEDRTTSFEETDPDTGTTVTTVRRGGA